MSEFLFHASLSKRNWVCSTGKHSLIYLKKSNKEALFWDFSCYSMKKEGKKIQVMFPCTSELVSTKVRSFEPARLFLSLQIGGTEEYKICRGIKEGRITKPVVCWCIGTCATMFSSEVCVKMGANAWSKYIYTTGRKNQTSLTVPKLSRITNSNLTCRS